MQCCRMSDLHFRLRSRSSQRNLRIYQPMSELHKRGCKLRVLRSFKYQFNNLPVLPSRLLPRQLSQLRRLPLNMCHLLRLLKLPRLLKHIHLGLWHLHLRCAKRPSSFQLPLCQLQLSLPQLPVL